MLKDNTMSAYDYLKVMAERQAKMDFNHSDFPILALSQLIATRCISGTHAFGFTITKEGIDLVTKMYPNTIKE